MAGRTVVLTVVRDWTLAVKRELNEDFLVRYVEASDQLLVNNNNNNLGPKALQLHFLAPLEIILQN